MKRYFITGLLVWIPLGFTLWVLTILNDTMDASLLLLPDALKPQNLVGHYIPGVGVLLTLAVILLTGLLVANYFGNRLLLYWEGMLNRIPVVKSIYGGVKQVSDTLFAEKGQAFRKALLVEYPRHGAWTIAFQTGQPSGTVASHLPGEYISVYVPTTPNPTSGFFLMLPKQDVIELDISVDAALKYVISMGVVAPELSKPSPRSSTDQAVQPH